MVRSTICCVRAFAEEQVAAIKLVVPICYRYIAFRGLRLSYWLQPIFDMSHRVTKLPAYPVQIDSGILRRADREAALLPFKTRPIRP